MKQFKGAQIRATTLPPRVTERRSLHIACGNASNGPFTPIVIATRNIVGKKEFNKLRGRAISLHS